MKIKFSRASAIEAIKSVSGNAGKGNHAGMEVVSHIHCAVADDVLTLTGSDVAMELSVPLAVASTGAGAFTVEAKRFASLIGSFDKDAEIEVSLDGMVTTVKCGKGKYKFEGLDPSSFPFIKFSPAQEFSVETSALHAAIKHTIQAAAVNDIRYYLNGICLDMEDCNTIRLVSTDGHRLATTKIEGKHPGINGRMIIPIDSVTVIQGMLRKDTTEFKLNGNAFRVTNGDYRLTGKLIDGQFPDWRRVLPDRMEQVSIDRAALSDLLKRVALFTGKYDGIHLSTKDGELIVETGNGEADDAMPLASGEGNHMVSINRGYLDDAASATDSKFIGLSFGREETDSFMFHDGENKSTVIMPMRL